MTKMELIGQGGIWKIYKIENQNNAFRIPQSCSESLINQFVYNYNLIKNIGLPTLYRVEKCEIDGKIGIICDNVNYSEEIIYVTYNSLYSDSQKLLYSLSKDILGDVKERTSSLAEEFRYQNKIDELTNFNSFLTNIKSHLELATEQGILIEFDSYFFGTKKKNSISEIDYKIIDLDHIFTYKNKAKLYELNIEEFTRAITGFLKYFVNEKKREKYLKELENEKYPVG